jgi:hypothetical protein
MNKYLSEGKNFSYDHDCAIDHQSDIFQLGKVFWYIFQHNAPIGSVIESDFLLDRDLFSVVEPMLHHSKHRRHSDIDDIIASLQPISAQLLKSAH